MNNILNTIVESQLLFDLEMAKQKEKQIVKAMEDYLVMCLHSGYRTAICEEAEKTDAELLSEWWSCYNTDVESSAYQYSKLKELQKLNALYK